MLLFSTNRTASIRPSRGLGEPEISDPAPERCCAVDGCVSTDTPLSRPSKNEVTGLLRGGGDVPQCGGAGAAQEREGNLLQARERPPSPNVPRFVLTQNIPEAGPCFRTKKQGSKPVNENPCFVMGDAARSAVDHLWSASHVTLAAAPGGPLHPDPSSLPLNPPLFLPWSPLLLPTLPVARSEPAPPWRSDLSRELLATLRDVAGTANIQLAENTARRSCPACSTVLIPVRAPTALIPPPWRQPMGKS